MILEFKDDEVGYRAWLASHGTGFVANLHKRSNRSGYPMVHSASRLCVSSTNRDNYTTGDYYKVCSGNLEALNRWSLQHCQKPLMRCVLCMK